MNKELTTDEMFKMLKYIKIFENDKEIRYGFKGNFFGEEFDFYLCFFKISKLIEHRDRYNTVVGIDMDLLQAINKKVEELKWI